MRKPRENGHIDYMKIVLISVSVRVCVGLRVYGTVCVCVCVVRLCITLISNVQAVH